MRGTADNASLALHAGTSTQRRCGVAVVPAEKRRLRRLALRLRQRLLCVVAFDLTPTNKRSCNMSVDTSQPVFATFSLDAVLAAAAVTMQVPATQSS